MNPKARMLPAISATWASLWVRALRGEGTSRSSGQNSSRKRIASLVATASVHLLRLAHVTCSLDPPPPA